jgi:hypothetical protein
MHDTVAAVVRPAVVGVAVGLFFYLLLQSAKRPAMRDPKTGVLVLQFGRILPIIMGSIAVGAPIGLVILSFVVGFKTPNEKFIPIGMGAAFLLLGGGMLPYLLKARVRVSDEGLEGEAPLMRVRKIAWPEVARVRFCSDGSLTLISRDNTRVKIQPFMVGISEFAGILEQRLPQEARQASQRDLEKFRTFVNR